MKKIIIITTVLLFNLAVFGQKYMTQSGTISFFSEAPLENIEALNNQVSSVINMENGEMAFSLLMKAFTFEKALMQEHFNEKYVHSDEFPKATFKGKIENFDNINLSTEPQEITIKGMLVIHGQSKEIEVKGTLLKQGEELIAKSVFSINLDDFAIKIPSAVTDNISNSIEIIVNINYEKL